VLEGGSYQDQGNTDLLDEATDVHFEMCQYVYTLRPACELTRRFRVVRLGHTFDEAGVGSSKDAPLSDGTKIM